MFQIRRISAGRLKKKKSRWIFFTLFVFFVCIRISKGALYKDFYYFISRPFWPGQFQKEVLSNSVNQEILIKYKQLENDNKRLREILSLQKVAQSETLSAAVIARKTGNWWSQIVLNKGSKDGVKTGSAVVGPGGLLGRINNTSFFTSSVILLSSPESKVGVWLDRVQTHGLLVGLGDDHPKLIFFTKDVDVKVGDIVSSSPASTLLPPNIPVGVIQSLDENLNSTKTAHVDLLGKPQAIDWVQILKLEF